MSGQPSPYSESDVVRFQNLAEQRGQLLRDMTDKWAEARVRFVERQRSQSAKIKELQIRERSLTWRIRDLERALMIVRQLAEKIEPDEMLAVTIQDRIDAAMQPTPLHEAEGRSAGAASE